jgi:hypothetical protein
LCAVALAALGSFAPASNAAQPHSFGIGFADSLFESGDAGLRSFWLDRAVDTDAEVVRIGVGWSGVAPRKPPAGFDPANPASSGYDWTNLDASVRDAAARGLRILLTVNSAPAWAEGPGRPANAYRGTWEPDPTAFGAFAQALASRYSGSFPDPLQPGAALPRVDLFEAWNEPNLDNYLSPQWQGTSLVGPILYRGLLNRFYTGVKAAQPTAKVIAGSMAPFGDPPGGARTPPVQFLRSLLCLQGGRLKPLACPEKAHFDVLSHHPIAVGPPSESAESPLDVTTPDLGRLTRVLRKAEETNRALPSGQKPLWVTEFWYDSSPPDPHGVPLYRQARWYEQDLHLFWEQGASMAVTLQLRDSPPGKGYSYTNQSGAYFLDGAAKPSSTAFRFPFVSQRTGRARVLAWGIAPRAGRVQIQARRGGRWLTLMSTRAGGRSRPFEVPLALHGHAQLRARLGSEASLIWKQQ